MKISVIGGKVMRAPDLERLDAKLPPREADVAPGLGLVAPEIGSSAFKSGLYRDDERTHTRDKALLVALGVDGDVPLAQARVNAGLDEPKQTAGLLAANDNELVDLLIGGVPAHLRAA